MVRPNNAWITSRQSLPARFFSSSNNVNFLKKVFPHSRKTTEPREGIPREPWVLLSHLFISTNNTAHVLSGYFRRLGLYRKMKHSKKGMAAHITTKPLNVTPNVPQPIENISDPYVKPPRRVDTYNTPVQDENIAGALLPIPSEPTSTLYWPCGTLVFFKSDFQRIMPLFSAEVRLSSDNLNEQAAASDMSPPDFRLVRNRDPETLEPCTGYFLDFNSISDACRYYRQTQDAQLNGIQVNFCFVDASKVPDIQQLPKYSIGKSVLLTGMSTDLSGSDVLEAISPYDHLENLDTAIVSVPSANPTTSAWMVKFNDSLEPRRFKRDFEKRMEKFRTPYSRIEILAA